MVLNRLKEFLFKSDFHQIETDKAHFRRLCIQTAEENAFLRSERARLKTLKPLPSEVSDTLKEVLSVRLEQAGFLKKENNPDALKAQVDLIRRHLRQELAVNEYLSENQKEGTPEFNTLPLETRKAYFGKVDAKV